MALKMTRSVSSKRQHSTLSVSVLFPACRKCISSCVTFRNTAEPEDGKRAVKKIAEQVDPMLPNDELFGANDEPLSIDEVDDKWAARSKQHIIYNLKMAARSHEHLKDKETPVSLLEAALKKLTHRDMDLTTIRTNDYGKARTLAVDIQKEANSLERQIYNHEKQLKKLLKKA